MTTPDNETTPGAKARKNTEKLSKDGKWRAFPKVPSLLLYVASGAHFGKLKINGKQIRRNSKFAGTVAL